MHKQLNEFEEYEFTESELELVKRIQNEIFLAYLKTAYTQIARKKLSWVIDPTKIPETLQAEAEARGQLQILESLINEVSLIEITAVKSELLSEQE